MKAIVSSGLVPIEITAPYRGYIPGSVVGFSPDAANRVVEAGAGKLVEVPDAATVDVTPPRPELAPAEILPQPLAAIPEDWQTSHELQRVKIAQQIAGEPVLRGKDANKIIRAEIARRKGA